LGAVTRPDNADTTPRANVRRFHRTLLRVRQRLTLREAVADRTKSHAPFDTYRPAARRIDWTSSAKRAVVSLRFAMRRSRPAGPGPLAGSCW
jgi:hypothetical protein